ncbi:natriuretic peptides B [Leptodactylus fuscus]|uniref:natriuretic peptides B n=1 Tax=Leptodactylus fuscus TaxID=238119 RepID=UPI003F4E6515
MGEGFGTSSRSLGGIERGSHLQLQGHHQLHREQATSLFYYLLTMEMKLSAFCTLLCATLQLLSCAAHPIADPDTDRELDSFKDVLERLEEKLSAIEDLQQSNPSTLEIKLDDREQAMTPEEAGTQISPESRGVRSKSFSINNSILKGMRSLQSPKMMRGLGCFGRRIDRIDSFSGLGCNGSRRF